MTAKVLLLRLENYDRKGIEDGVKTVFDHFGGVERFIKPGNRVLLKVNLVAGHHPERRVTTDPSVVRAVAGVVLQAGGYPFIADSPGIDGFSGAARKAGFAAVAEALGIPCVELMDPVPLPQSEGSSFQKIEVARAVLDSDVVINLPKMKTHGQMMLTLGVKNLFGCVVAQRKAEWHYSVGLKRELFASLLLDIWNGVRPALTILDGIVGMDGHGPTNGKPYAFGVLGGAEDALAMDFRLCRMMGIPLEDYPLWQAAKLRYLPQCAPDEEDLAGDFSLSHVWENLDIPKLDSLRLLPSIPFFGKTLEQALTSRPIHRPERCIGCGKCVAMCKAGAVVLHDRRLTFDYKKCIRCYCCHEMCPTSAIAFRDGLIRKFTKFFGK